jgi:putative transposase
MSQSLSKIWTHLVFSTKERYAFLSDLTVRQQMHAYLATTLKENNCPTLAVGGVSDHVHALFILSKNHSIADVVGAIKRASSKWVKGEGIQLRNFHWQEGYGAFSISQSHIERVQKYILNQESHHRRKTFKDEFRALLTKYEVEYDKRYVWD